MSAHDKWESAAKAAVLKISETCDALPPAHLDEAGRCCGRKPRPYLRDGHLFCSRCDRSYDIRSGRQVQNWAWREMAAGFIPSHTHLGSVVVSDSYDTAIRQGKSKEEAAKIAQDRRGEAVERMRLRWFP
jgi:hypothetical protein